MYTWAHCIEVLHLAVTSILPTDLSSPHEVVCESWAFLFVPLDEKQRLARILQHARLRSPRR